MINDILNEMIKRGFVDSYGDIYDMNENDDDSDHVFDSPGCDIYCKAVVVLNEDSYDNALLTFAHC